MEVGVTHGEARVDPLGSSLCGREEPPPPQGSLSYWGTGRKARGQYNQIRNYKEEHNEGKKSAVMRTYNEESDIVWGKFPYRNKFELGNEP